jgi:hypothetical protein
LVSDVRDYAAILAVLEDRFVHVWGEIASDIPDGLPILRLLRSIATDLDVREDMAWIRYVQKVSDKLATGHLVYAHYRLLSSEMHFGLGSAVPYILGTLKGDMPNKAEPFSLGAHMALFDAVASCVWAGWSTDSLYGSELFEPVVRPVADRLELVPLLRICD